VVTGYEVMNMSPSNIEDDVKYRPELDRNYLEEEVDLNEDEKINIEAGGGSVNCGKNEIMVEITSEDGSSTEEQVFLEERGDDLYITKHIFGDASSRRLLVEMEKYFDGIASYLEGN